jgi:hypothetical protein
MIALSKMFMKKFSDLTNSATSSKKAPKRASVTDQKLRLAVKFKNLKLYSKKPGRTHTGLTKPFHFSAYVTEIKTFEKKLDDYALKLDVLYNPSL